MEHDESERDASQVNSVGKRLRNAREAAELTRGDVAARTKIAERHLHAIEEDRFDDLAGRTYAIGFTRSYARVVAPDAEAELVEHVRRYFDAHDDQLPSVPAFEPGDPARVPPGRTVLLATLVLALGVVGFFIVSGNFLSTSGELPELTESRPVTAAPSPKSPAAAPAVAAEGPVTITAREPDIWVRVSNGAGERLFEKLMDLGETYTVPPGTQGAVLRTGRPDALTVAIAGRDLPPLADRPITGDIALDPAALRARPAAGSAPAGATATP
jgi:cytoskeleton protein RodZ